MEVINPLPEFNLSPFLEVSIPSFSWVPMIGAVPTPFFDELCKTNKFLIDHDKLVVLDWDDTCFPTNEYKLVAEREEGFEDFVKIFQELDNKVVDLLTSICRGNLVIIVTNGNRPWIDLTLSLYPNTKKWIQDTEIPFLIARECPCESLFYSPQVQTSVSTRYASMFSGSEIQWKRRAIDLFFAFYRKSLSIRFITIVGDSLFDLDLYEYVSQKYPVQSDFIKLKHNPSLKDVEQQFSLITSCVEKTNWVEEDEYDF
jgi:hypothetical protein